VVLFQLLALLALITLFPRLVLIWRQQAVVAVVQDQGPTVALAVPAAITGLAAGAGALATSLQAALVVSAVLALRAS
jgi:hypothetical protein